MLYMQYISFKNAKKKKLRHTSHYRLMQMQKARTQQFDLDLGEPLSSLFMFSNPIDLNIITILVRMKNK